MPEKTAVGENLRWRLLVCGVVQGVGFRPQVYRLAQHHHLTGFVGNNSSGVFIEIQGAAADLAMFLHELEYEPPPLAHIESIETHEITVQDEADFTIVDSEAQIAGHTLISPDLCVCDDCLREMTDPHNRRYRYPFINCTNCGTRFTIIKDAPYDRPLTTMAQFHMCDNCAAEYHDAGDRRFHAQPNACPDCGPQITFIKGKMWFSGDAAIERTFASLQAGEIVAVKGVGGFHLACDAQNDAAVEALRLRKGRPDKPLAIMVSDLMMAKSVVHINDAEKNLLQSRERPIVLLRKKSNSLSSAIAPNNSSIGVMLPYAPLHYLILDRPLVMTSGNSSSEPIVKENQTALEQLAHIADAFLLHDRDIHAHCDDSVLRVVHGAPYPLRRSRGYVPLPILLPSDTPPILAVGGELKNTFCLTRDRQAFMSQHIGDMQNLETLQAFERAYQHLCALFHIEPQAVTCDKHPHYLSTQWAERFAIAQHIPLVKVQHHRAHIASLIAEHQLNEPVIGFSYDGTGYGDDGSIWGGEVFITGSYPYKRIYHLPYMPLPGGDAAIKNPYRLALAYLWASAIPWDMSLPPCQHAKETERRVLKQQLERNLNVIQTSSMGRLFDVIAALIGVRETISYEGQAAIEMEAIACAADDSYPFDSIGVLLEAVVRDVRNKRPIAEIAGLFHSTIASHIVTTACTLRQQFDLSRVALSGGVFQNMTLLRQTIERLEASHFDVFIHRQVPCNDGGLALGQAVIASHLLKGDYLCV